MLSYIKGAHEKYQEPYQLIFWLESAVLSWCELTTFEQQIRLSNYTLYSQPPRAATLYLFFGYLARVVIRAHSSSP